MQNLLLQRRAMYKFNDRYLIIKNPRIISWVFILFLFFNGCTEKKDYLPESFGDMIRTSLIKGEEAKRIIDQLHNKEVAPVKNEIGYFTTVRGKAIIYITYYDDNETANSELIKMTDKIAPGNTPFIRGEYIRFDEKNIYRCFGMGQTHFIFAEEKNLYWITVDTHIGHQLLNDYLIFVDKLEK